MPFLLLVFQAWALLILNIPQLVYGGVVLSNTSEVCSSTLLVWALVTLFRLAGELVCSWAAVANGGRVPDVTTTVGCLTRFRSTLETLSRVWLFVGTLWVFSANSCSDTQPGFVTLCVVLLGVQYCTFEAVC